MQFFDRLRRVSTVRRSADADYSRSTHDLPSGLESPLSGPSSPTDTHHTHRLLRKLRRAASPSSERTAMGSVPTRPDDSIRRAISERVPKAPTTTIHISTGTTPIPAHSASPLSTTEGPSAPRSSFSDLPPTTDLSERIARRPVYRRASASLPALALSNDDYSRMLPGPSSLSFPLSSSSTSAPTEELPGDLIERASSAPPAPESAISPLMDTFLAAGLESSSLRTGPATHTLNTGLVHQYEQFLECAVDIEVWPASALQHHASLDAIVQHVSVKETRSAIRVNSVTRSAVSGSSGSSSRTGARSRVGRTRTRIPRVKSISVESARRHTSKRRATSKPKAAEINARRLYARVPATHRRRATARRRIGSWGKTSRRTHSPPAMASGVSPTMVAASS